MDKLVMALGPVFAAGLGIQQLMEILDPILDKVVPNYKKVFLGVVSLAAGLALAFGAGLRTLQPLGVTGAGFLDPFVTGLIISGGTEGINSILKFLKYKKEETKNEAAAKISANASALAAGTASVPDAEALATMNRK